MQKQPFIRHYCPVSLLHTYYEKISLGPICVSLAKLWWVIDPKEEINSFRHLTDAPSTTTTVWNHTWTHRTSQPSNASEWNQKLPDLCIWTLNVNHMEQHKQYLQMLQKKVKKKIIKSEWMYLDLNTSWTRCQGFVLVLFSLLLV